MTIKAFKPTDAATVNIDISNSNQRIALYKQRREIQVYVYNDGSATAWIAFGDANVVASTSTGIPIGTKQGRVFTVSIPETLHPPIYAAAIAAGSTGKIYFTPGEGGTS